MAGGDRSAVLVDRKVLNLGAQIKVCGLCQCHPRYFYSLAAQYFRPKKQPLLDQYCTMRAFLGIGFSAAKARF
ncbi:MAG: hypothetical protein ACI9WS_000611 [Paraglaciecola psychrophila]|jgi:hypothetical protein